MSLSLSLFATMIIPAGISIYTFNFARWLYRRGQIRGAIGVFLIALLSALYPLLLLFRGFER